MARPAPPALAYQDDGALLTADPAKRGQLLDQIKQSGSRRIRVNAIYGQVRKNNQYDFTALDSLVNDARARGINTQMTLVGTPRYMATQPGVDMGLSYQHADPKMAGRYAKDVAQHFAGRVDRYSAWNEPNLETFLADRSAKRYRAIYQQMRQGIKSVSPNAAVLLGELMPGVSTSPNAKDKAMGANFLRRVLSAGNKPLRSEGLALHPYGWGGEAAGLHGGPNTYLGINQLDRAQSLLAEMQRQGRFQTNKGGRVPLYLTEYGLKRDAVPNAGKRAKLLARAYRAAQDAGAREMTYYQMVPSVSGSWDTATTPGMVGSAIRRGQVTARAAKVRR